MFKSYLKIAWRKLQKNKLYAIVNLVGLTTGLTSCILIGMYIGHELSYDRFQKNAERIARVTMEYNQSGTLNYAAVTGTKVGPQFKRVFPGVDAFTRVIKTTRVVKNNANTFDEKGFLYADSAFFRIFSFHFIQGNAFTSLQRPKTLVISHSMALKYFGKDDVIGKTLNIANGDDYEITGITEDVPANSQIQYDFVGSFQTLGISKTEEWWTANYTTYLLLNNDNGIPALQKQVTAYMNTKDVRIQTVGAGEPLSSYLTYHLEPLKKVHLFSSLDGLEPNGNIIYIYVLGAIAILILLIACVNYTNLATAQSSARTTEVGIRKVLGAERKELFSQFMGESALLSFFALILSIVIVAALLPAFNSMTGKTIPLSFLFNPLPLTGLAMLSLLVSFIAGAYPAMVLAGSRITDILKAGFRFSSSGNSIRKTLIIFQFVISVFLIIATIIILQQLSYIRNKELGYDKDHVIVLPIDWQIHANYNAIKDAIKLYPQVKNVSGAYETPVFIQWSDGITTSAGPGGDGKTKLSVNAIPVDLDFINTMGMQLIAGNDFSPTDLKQDTTGNNKNLRHAFMLNETAVKALGWEPSEAIGKTIYRNEPGVIKAVVKDFHFSSMHQPIGPMLIFLDTSFTHEMFVKISGQNIPATIAFLEKTWKERVPSRPFEYHFLDEDYAHLYITEQRTAKLFSSFASIAILLACLGLFALAAYSTMQRTKEIGIRKVLGASLTNITLLLSKEFVILVGISIIIASPLAWYAAQKWLQDFAYRVPIQLWVFVSAGLASIAIALITVSYQAIKAGLANPVKSLKSE